MVNHIPAGWYPDPAASSGLRWWDGSAWTAQVSQASPAVAPADIDEESRRGQRARVGLLVAVPAQLASVAFFHSQFKDFVDELRELEAGQPAPDFAGGGWAVVTQVSGAVGLLVGVLFLLWFARSAANAQALGLPARREPAAGVAGFIVPVINLWWPYQSTSDLLPPGDARRPLVLRWFLLWMVGGLVGTVATWVSVFVSGSLGWALLAVPAVLTTLAALAARHLIGEIVTCHAGLASAGR